METASKQLELDVELKDLPAQDYLGKTFTASGPAVGQGVQKAFVELYACIGAAGATPSGPPFLTASEPVGGSMEIEVGAPCSPVPEPAAGLHRGRLEAGRAAVTVHRGPYEQISGVYPRLFAWVAEHGHQPAGRPREIYLNGPAEVSKPEEYLTQLLVPIA
ncbi:MAG: GyrI-like domain-containing protein [Isosphaeraceae bacterium]